jgi:K+-transporting ATPase ATPase A chain
VGHGHNGGSNGSVNSMHDSFTPIGGLCRCVDTAREVIYGGVGSGLYGMIDVRAGRGIRCRPHDRPHAEYLGKKIEAYE